MDTLELQRRQRLAWDAIKQSFGTAAASDSVDLFIEHHLEALPAGYWLQQLGTETPEPSAWACSCSAEPGAKTTWSISISPCPGR